MNTIDGYDALVIVVVYSAMAVLSLLGIIGNVISMMVWTRPQLKSPSAVLLSALGFSDTIIILSSFPYKYLGILAEYSMLCHHYSAVFAYFDRFIMPFLVFWGYPVYVMSRTTSIYLTIAMTLERFIAVCYPFDYQNICSYSRTYKITAVIVMFSILYNLNNFWKTVIHTETRPDGTVIRFYYTEVELTAVNALVWLDLFVIQLCPLAIIIICNTATCYKLKMASRARQDITDRQKKENRLTMMLMYVVFEFFFCYFVTAMMVSDDFLDTFFDLFNASINFVTYITFGKPFRKTFVNMFCSCYQKKPIRIRDPINAETKL